MIITIDDLLKQVREYNASEEPIIYEAYRLAEKLHENQPRESGDPYITHPLAVAYTLSLLKADRDTICAALLHDAIEDTGITKEEIERLFNSTVADLVDGVTKMRKLDYNSSEEAEAATVRKIIMSMVKDPRILLIKLADRIHNMQTLEFKKNKLRQKEFAIETLDFFAPLAHSIGAYYMKYELEDLSFKFAMPEAYNDVYSKRAAIEIFGQPLLEDMISTIRGALEGEGIPSTTKIRIKNVYGIYTRLQDVSRLSEMDDLMGINIVVDNARNCYYTLGIIHDHFIHDKGKIKDYITAPKPNMYQALHTNIRAPKAKMVQARIRDPRMNKIAEHGLGAYWMLYQGKALEEMLRDFSTKMPYYNAINVIDGLYSNNAEFVNQIRREVFTNYIFVDTASGETIELPAGATPLDFAYKIHSKIGDGYIKAVVNDEMVPIDYILKNSDCVKIMTGEDGAGPEEAWLDIAQTAYAKRKIREYLRKSDK